MFDKLQQLKDDRECNNALIAISEGNAEALSVIYRLYGRMIMSISVQIVKNYHDAEDVLQEVMLRIAQNATKYQKNTNPRAWILAIARNAAIDHLKNKTKIASYEDGVGEAHNSHNPDSDPSIPVLIKDALSKLSDVDQMIIKLKLFVGLSHSEIASVMNLTKSASEKRYERAIKKVRDYFMKG